MITQTRKYRFHAAHRNKNAGEKCGRIHGHTYRVELIMEFDSMERGVTKLFSEIDSVVDPIIAEYDHYFLLWDNDPLMNALEVMGEEVRILPFETSAENMAIWLFNEIKDVLPELVQIELKETDSSKIIYNG